MISFKLYEQIILASQMERTCLVGLFQLTAGSLEREMTKTFLKGLHTCIWVNIFNRKWFMTQKSNQTQWVKASPCMILKWVLSLCYHGYQILWDIRIAQSDAVSFTSLTPLSKPTSVNLNNIGMWACSARLLEVLKELSDSQKYFW